MRIALYSHHHDLPFWHRPVQPYAMFNPELMAGWRMKWNAINSATSEIFKGTWVWAFMAGLHQLDLPFLANVSLICENGTVELPKRVWVQITTMPAAVDEKGIPVVVAGGKVLVKSLWGTDNGTYSPWEWVGQGQVEGDPMSPDFWKQFFLRGLRSCKGHYLDVAVKARDSANLYNAVQ